MISSSSSASAVNTAIPAAYVAPVGAVPNGAALTPAATRIQNIKNIQTTLSTACALTNNIDAQKKQFIRVTKNIPTHDLYNMLVGGHAELREILQNFIFDRMRINVMEDIEKGDLEEKAAPASIQPAQPHMDIFAACLKAAQPQPAQPQPAQLAKQPAPQVLPRPIQVINKLPATQPPKPASSPSSAPLAAPPAAPSAAAPAAQPAPPVAAPAAQPSPPVTAPAAPPATPSAAAPSAQAAPPVAPLADPAVPPTSEQETPVNPPRPNQKARRWIKKQQNQ
jgi:hypothetical protein